MQLLILDADGVFMNEMPYWRTALTAALLHAGLHGADDDAWRRLDHACLQSRQLQRITKSRGCNSNWDLAAVMIRALESSDTTDAVRAAVEQGAFDRAALALAEGMERLRRPIPSDADPLTGFGIERSGSGFKTAVAQFQAVFQKRKSAGWCFARHELYPPPEQTAQALARLQAPGRRLAICTSRGSDELLAPISGLGVAQYFDHDRIVTNDHVGDAQRRTGRRPLGKPHWFPLAAAVCGVDRAVAALGDGESLRMPGDVADAIFIGDASADFMSAVRCRERGLPVGYIHVDSGVSTDETLEQIRAHGATLTVLGNLAAVQDWLTDQTR